MILSWKTDLLPTQIIYYIISGVFIIGGLLGALRFMEYAIVSDSGIVIKIPFGTIAFISWQSVVSIEKKRLITYNSRCNIYMPWIVLRTDYTQIRVKSRLNKKGNTTFRIVASKKNLSVFEEYATQYCSACIDLCGE